MYNNSEKTSLVVGTQYQRGGLDFLTLELVDVCEKRNFAKSSLHNTVVQKNRQYRVSQAGAEKNLIFTPFIPHL